MVLARVVEALKVGFVVEQVNTVQYQPGERLNVKPVYSTTAGEDTEKSPLS
jgi:hypothetical protein